MARKRSRRPPLRTLARRWSVVAGIALLAYLYYHPLRTYFGTRSELSQARGDVAQLTAEKHALQKQLNVSTSLDALAREARDLGYVRPGEHLYIVKGIDAWLSAHNRSAHGR
jgi:cell division protein FtsB